MPHRVVFALLLVGCGVVCHSTSTASPKSDDSLKIEHYCEAVKADDDDSPVRLTVVAKLKLPANVKKAAASNVDPNKNLKSRQFTTATLVIERVDRSLARRETHPLHPPSTDQRNETRIREIVFQGPRAEAIAMLGSHRRCFELLAQRRLLSDGKAAIPEVSEAIERDLWNDGSGENRFARQARLIALLAELTQADSDGPIVRMIDHMLERAERGKPFPGVSFPNSTPADPARQDSRFIASLSPYAALDNSHNHSLAWLLLTLGPDRAAQRYGERLVTLRDISSYGWKDEAQWVLDHLRLLDRMEVKRIEARMPQTPLAAWQVGHDVVDSGDNRAAFSRDGRLLAVISQSTGKVWRLPDYAIVAKTRFASKEEPVDVRFSKDGKTVQVQRGTHDHIVEWDVVTGKVRELLSTSGGEAAGNGSLTPEFKLSFPTFDVKRIGSQLWTLEELTDEFRSAEPNSPTPPDEPLRDCPPFKAVVLRQRATTGSHAVMAEQRLSFCARRLLVSGDEKSVAIVGDDRIAFAAVATRKLTNPWPWPLKQFNGWYVFGDLSGTLSHDGKLLAVCESGEPPHRIDTATGTLLPNQLGSLSPLVAVEFVDNQVLRTRDVSGVVHRWNATTGKRMKSEEEDREWKPTSLHDRMNETTFPEVDGSVWFFWGHGGGKYERHTTFDVYVIAPENCPKDSGVFVDWISLAKRRGVLRGQIQPEWLHYKWLGLTPGGEYFHVGTHIFSRRDLKPVSAANVMGEIEQIVFSRDGRRYALTTLDSGDPTFPRGRSQDPGNQYERQLVRVHDTLSGKTLFSKQATAKVKWIDLSPDLSKLVLIDREQQLEIWQVGSAESNQR